MFELKAYYLLLSGINKPNKQTVLPMEAVEEFFKTFPLKKVRNLGGKLGLTLREELNCTSMGDLANISQQALQQHFEQKTAYVFFSFSLDIYN